ncbi:acyltransferase [Vibrio sp. ZSDZ34]|uniref:Acyltransferase n=1 Tax=Vibrio gelatinilyticus TaxID=2893468 RepID=A0A9X2AX66_9VIBR|nr:acyltransferase [Vibrio gelatinilyticus]MCJ2375343.1 acyltransferase [Vibrio gelatinilyticus]
MSTMTISNFKHWLRNHPNPKMREIFVILKKVRNFEFPTPKVYNKVMHFSIKAVTSLVNELLRVLIYTPAFKGRLAQYGKQLYLYGGIPFVSGSLSISIGNQCRISGHTTFSGRSCSYNPQLIVGDNVDIGWQNTIAVGRKVILGDNVRLAGKVYLFGYSGHPLDAKQRAEGAPDEESRIGDIHLEKDVWLASNVIVQSGVTIGQGTIVAAGSVVTKSLPPFVLAGGSPAKVIRSIAPDQNKESTEARYTKEGAQ